MSVINLFVNNCVPLWWIDYYVVMTHSFACIHFFHLLTRCYVRGDASKSAHPGFASKSAHSQWLIDWLGKSCLYFFPVFVGNHPEFRLHFCFTRRMITMPIGRLELAKFGRFVSGKCRFLKCAGFEAKTGCADFEACPRIRKEKRRAIITAQFYTFQ